jgi:Cft2 family RNA processing exonuclease
VNPVRVCLCSHADTDHGRGLDYLTGRCSHKACGCTRFRHDPRSADW